jgi:hypothetical protein
MMNQYYILSYPGAGMMFFTTVFAHYLQKIDNDVSISLDGNCHNIGNGIFKDTEHVGLTGWRIEKAVNNKKNILNGHCNDLAHVKQILPNCKILLIDIGESFLKTTATMRFYKTMNPMSKKEYDKWINRFQIKHWPDYDPDLINNPELVKNDIVSLDTVWYKEWANGIDRSLVDYVINYETILGVDNQPLTCKVAEILNKEVDPTIDEFIDKYQAINQNLYFNMEQ